VTLSAKKLGLASTFIDAEELEHLGLCIDVRGGERAGKSDFACTVALYGSPKGITVYLTLDRNYKAPVKRYRRLGARIMVSEHFISLPIEPPDSPRAKDFQRKVDIIAKTNRPILQAFKTALWSALDSPRVKAVIIDNGTLLYRLVRYAKFGYIAKVPRHLYIKSNVEMDSILSKCRASGKNVVWIHRQTEIYKGDDRTGKFERSGHKDVGYEVQAQLVAFRDKKGKFCIEILDSWLNPDIVGMELKGSARTFENLADLVFTGEEDDRE
jgi:hypothetical protein